MCIHRGQCPNAETWVVVETHLRIFQAPASPSPACFETISALCETTCPAGPPAVLLFADWASYLFEIFVPRWPTGLGLFVGASSYCVDRGIRLGI